MSGHIEVDGRRIELAPARVEQLIDLRHTVLRQGMPREAAIFDGDAGPEARHYAAFCDGVAVCCTTLHPIQWEGEPAWQLRGMATDPAFRAKGIGQAVLKFMEADVAATSLVRLLWCNARVPASGFYLKMGWAIRSEVFDIPTAGPHYRMTKRLPS